MLLGELGLLAPMWAANGDALGRLTLLQTLRQGVDEQRAAVSAYRCCDLSRAAAVHETVAARSTARNFPRMHDCATPYRCKACGACKDENTL